MDVAGRHLPPTVRLRRLAAELRKLREAAGLTRQEAAARVDVNQTTLWKIETAKARPQRRTLTALLGLYGVTDERQRAGLLELAQLATQRGWLQTYDDELPPEYQTYISFEGEARSVRNYESLFVPGLLQTEDYARASIAGVLTYASPADVDSRVNARMQRQATIDRPDPLRLFAIMDEAALRREVGGPKVMTAQLRHLIEVSRQPHITVQVLPYRVGAHPGMHGAFAIMDFADPADPELVYVENMAGALFLERPDELRRYTGVFQDLRAAALSPADSLTFIEDLVDEGR